MGCVSLKIRNESVNILSLCFKGLKVAQYEVQLQEGLGKN
jgi:hypothetical protein